MSTAETMTRYLVYRHGANARNQPGRARQPVAIVEASSRDEACECATQARPTVWDSAWLKLDSNVDVWANQTVTAVPVSRAPKTDVRELEERPL